jgi:hypothetical protein
MNRFQLSLLAASLSFTPFCAMAQDIMQDSAIEQQQQAIQEQITNGIATGNLSAADIAALQAQQQALATQSRGGAVAGTVSPGIQREITQGSAGTSGSLANGTNATRSTAQTTTGPDPFTYNSLGPDAYQAQKYQNPGYNVPAYPTTQPEPAGVSQQYSGASAGAPYGAGYAQAPGAGSTGSGVYVYHPAMNR